MGVRAQLLNTALHEVVKRRRINIHADPDALERFMGLVPPWPRFARVQGMDVWGVKAHWVQVPWSRPDRILLFAHGGAYRCGSTYTHRHLVWRMARAAGCRVLSVEYRLAPDHPYPAGRDDLITAYRWARERHPEASIAMAGDSAGGGLVLSALAELDSARDAMPSATTLFSPWADLSFSGSSWRTNEVRDPWLSQHSLEDAARSYLHQTPADDPGVSTVFWPFQRPVPTLFQVADSEVLLDDTRSVARKLQDAGGNVEVEVWHDLPHVWQMFAPVIPEAQAAITRAGHFLERHWSPTPA